MVFFCVLVVRLKRCCRSEVEVLSSLLPMPSNDNGVVEPWYSLDLGACLEKSGSYLELEKQRRVGLSSGKRGNWVLKAIGRHKSSMVGALQL